VNFTGYRPRIEMPSYFAASDVLVISLNDEPLFELTVPLKFYSYLTASRPIYSVINGEVARMVDRYSLGITADPSDVESISRGFEKLYYASKAELMNYSANAAEMIGNRFSKEKNIARLTSILWPPEITLRQAVLNRAI
jgi:glycosyltransferase involved in cell wall biosynthesis